MFESLQAKILAVSAAVALVTAFISAVKADGVLVAFVAFFIGLAILLLNVFDVNCVILGGCNIWGWIKFALLEILIVVAIIATIAELAKKKEEEKKTE